MTFHFCPPKNLQDLTSKTFPDGKRYYTLPNGNKVPSITTVVGAQKKKHIMAWRKRVGEAEANRISNKASRRGTKLHTICENYINNESDYYGDVMPDVKSMFKTIKPVIDKYINNIHYQEQSLWSTKLQLAGRVDLIAEFDGVLSVIDFKTSSKIKEKEDIPDYFQQCTAYAICYEELIGQPINQNVILMTVEDHVQPLVFIEKTEDHINNLLEHIKFHRENK